MILRNLRLVRLDKNGKPTIDSQVEKISNGSIAVPTRFFVPIPNMPVYEFDLYFADSYRFYNTEYIRAKDIREAKAKIKRKYSNVVQFKWE